MKPTLQFPEFEAAIHASYPDVELDYVVAQRGGTGIASGYWTERGDGYAKLRAAITEAGDSLVGMVWYQGEEDATRADAAGYEERLRGLIADVREMVGRRIDVIVVQLASNGGSEPLSHLVVREAQRRVARDDADVALVATSDLTLGDMTVHLDDASEREVGRRAGHAVAALTYGGLAGRRFDAARFHFGPSIVSAHVAGARRDQIVVRVAWLGDAALDPAGLRQSFFVLDGAAPRDLASLGVLDEGYERWRWPSLVAQTGPDELRLVFDAPLPAEATLGWAASHGDLGPNRTGTWSVRGFSDSTGPAPATAFVPLMPWPAARADEPVQLVLERDGDGWQAHALRGDGGRVEVDAWRASAVGGAFEDGRFVADPLGGFASLRADAVVEGEALVAVASWSEPRAREVLYGFQGLGGSADNWIALDEEAGAPGFRQTSWNNAGGGPTPHVVDSEGMVTRVSVNLDGWYETTVPGDDTPDGRLMRGFQSSATRVPVSGLVPSAPYDVVVYFDALPNTSRRFEQTLWIAHDSRDRQVVTDRVLVREPEQGVDPETHYAFSSYVEATEGNDYVGNFVVFRGVMASPEGQLFVRTTEGLSALQLRGPASADVVNRVGTPTATPPPTTPPTGADGGGVTAPVDASVAPARDAAVRDAGVGTERVRGGCSAAPSSTSGAGCLAWLALACLLRAEKTPPRARRRSHSRGMARHAWLVFALAACTLACGSRRSVVDSVPDACGDGLDGDADGRIDEDCFCAGGETQACFPSGRPSECVSARQPCVVEGVAEWGRWGSCVELDEVAEACGDGLDDDCDGSIDEDCPCTETDRACGSSVGACRPGNQRCVEGRWGACVGAIEPSVEVCDDGIDGDCDGRVDPPHVCSCVPEPEVCANGADDDCDGTIDEPECATAVDAGLPSDAGPDTCDDTLAAPRLVAPLASTRVSSTSPTFEWDSGSAVVEICRDRECSTSLARFAADGGSARAPAALERGVHFFRVFGRAGERRGCEPSESWAFVVETNGEVDTYDGGFTDVDGNGLEDVVLGSPDEGRVFVYRARDDGTFHAPIELRSPPGITRFGWAVSGVGDLDGDGDGELAIEGFVGDYPVVFVAEGSPDGTEPSSVRELRRLRASDTMRTPFVTFPERPLGDFHHDGYADLALGMRGQTGSWQFWIEVYSGSKEGPRSNNRVQAPDDLPPTDYSGFGSALAGGDLDGDRRSDLVIGARGDVFVALGAASGPSAVVALERSSSSTFGEDRVAVVDVTGDGRGDVLAPNLRAFGQPSTWVFWGAAPFAGRIEDVVSARIESIAFDVDGDGFRDGLRFSSVLGTTTRPEPLLERFRSSAVGMRSVADRVDLPAGTFVEWVGDLDRDGLLDVIARPNEQADRREGLRVLRGTSTGFTLAQSLSCPTASCGCQSGSCKPLR